MSTVKENYKPHYSLEADLPTTAAIQRRIFDLLADLQQKNPGKPIKLSPADQRYLDWLEARKKALKQEIAPPKEVVDDFIRSWLDEGIVSQSEPLRPEFEFPSEDAYFEYLFDQLGHFYPGPFQKDAEKQRRWQAFTSERFAQAPIVDGLSEAFRTRNPDLLLPELPEFYRDRFEKMEPHERRRRLLGVLDYLEAEDILNAQLTAAALHKTAERLGKQGWLHLKQLHEEGHTPTAQHKREATTQYHQRIMRKSAWRAELYLSAASKAVGGPKKRDPEREDDPDWAGRPEFVSNRVFWKWADERKFSQEIMKNLRLVNVADPLNQLPASEVAKQAEARHMAEQRLFIDATLERIRENGHWPCWITVTLPGRFVPYGTKEDTIGRTEEWDMRLGAAEAKEVMQAKHHQLMAMLRQRGLRPYGLWTAQAQVNGVPHRHYLLALPELEQARELCDSFRLKFASGSAKRGKRKRRGSNDDTTVPNSRGCEAYVVGDDDDRYAPDALPDGSEESLETVSRYLARYATRFSVQAMDFTQEIKPTNEMRHAAWSSTHRLRTLTFVGMKREGGKAAWRTLWNAMSRGDAGTSLRSILAIQLLERCRNAGADAARARAEDDPEGAIVEAKAAGRFAYEAALAAGVWPDEDFTEAESEWLKSELEALRESLNEDSHCWLDEPIDEAAPVVLHDVKISKFGEERKVVRGVIPCHWLMRTEIAESDSEEMIEWKTELRNQKTIFKSVDEWELLEKALAEERAMEMIKKYVDDEEAREEVFNKWSTGVFSNEEGLKDLIKRMYYLSDIPSDPSHRPSGGVGGSIHGSTEKPPPI